MSRRASSHLHQHAKVKGRPLSASGRDFKRGRNKAERGEPYDRPADNPRTGQWRLTEHPELIFHLYWPPLYTRTEDPDWNRVFKLLQREERRLLGLNACLAGLSCNKVSHIKDTWTVNTETIERRWRKKKSSMLALCVFSPVSSLRFCEEDCCCNHRLDGRFVSRCCFQFLSFINCN